MATRRLRIDLAYDGAPFAGFAKQPGQHTVQGTLEGALSRLTGAPSPTTCAGRTDRGVHARAQVVHVDVDESAAARTATVLRELGVMRFRLDRLVGAPITIWSVREVPASFDARFSALRREYRYRLVDAPSIDPLRRHDRWHLPGPVSVPLMRAAARHLIGEHDFATFCRKAAGKTTTRRLARIAVSRPERGTVDIRLAAPAFCHQQVRAIVGCLVEVGRARREPDWVGDVLEARDRSVAAAVAPAHGLTLERVSYGRAWPAAPPAERR